jgi:hypothetical protein
MRFLLLFSDQYLMQMLLADGFMIGVAMRMAEGHQFPRLLATSGFFLFGLQAVLAELVKLLLVLFRR